MTAGDFAVDLLHRFLGQPADGRARILGGRGAQYVGGGVVANLAQGEDRGAAAALVRGFVKVLNQRLGRPA